MSVPTIPTDVRVARDSHATPGVGGPSPVDTHQACGDHHAPGVGGPNSCDVQIHLENHGERGVAGIFPTESPIQSATARSLLAARSAPTPLGALNELPPATALPAHSKGPTPSATPRDFSTAKVETVSLTDPFLALSADVLDDLERVRIANENRLRQLTRSATDADGEERGFGLDESHPDVARLAALVSELAKSEHQATLNLNRLMRAHPLGPWVAEMPGVGIKQAARLLASIGDPAWNDLADDWRTLRQLYSYCGYGDATAQVRRRGHKSNWDTTAKTRCYLIAVSCVKVGRGPLREVYDEGRVRYADAVHESECVRCGPSGRPALPGSPISAGHQHARAVRLVSKAVLRGLWREARRLHGFDDEEATS